MASLISCGFNKIYTFFAIFGLYPIDIILNKSPSFIGSNLSSINKVESNSPPFKSLIKLFFSFELFKFSAKL